jgi:hypothetical protein
VSPLSKDVPLAAVVEIVERGRKSDDTSGGSVIVPNSVRINGVSVLTTGGVKVHDIEVLTGDGPTLATVTITLPVRMLIIAAEGDLPAREE